MVVKRITKRTRKTRRTKRTRLNKSKKILRLRKKSIVKGKNQRN